MSVGADGLEHVYLTCSNCRAYLVEMAITMPQLKVDWLVKATCPWCQDESFPREVHGGFVCGGVGKTKKDDETGDIPSTIVVGEDFDGPVVIFHTQKANANAKPLYEPCN